MSGNGPQSLPLAEHLRLCTVAELTDYLRFWGPHEKRRNGRTDLIERLQRLMTDENVVYAKVDLLSEKVRTVLLGLLRKTHYTSDLQGLFRGIDGLEMEYYEAEAALNALAKRGFVRTSRDQDWLHYGRSAYAIPVEIALVMRGLAGADTRPFPRIFLHAEYTPSSVEAAANEPIPDPPESVAAAVETLPNAVLRLIATEAIEGFGGIVTRHEFADVFGARGVRWRSARFLREFGARGLGTVGHLDLRDKGIGLEDDALVFFAEVVERHVADARTRVPEHDIVLSAHGDLMSDVCTLLGLLKEFPVRLAKDGSVYKAARARIAEELQFPLQPLVDRKEIAERALALVRDLGLAAEADGGQLAMTEKGDAWRRAPLLAKVEQAYGRLLLAERPTLRSQHLRQLQPILVELLQSDGGTSWWPGLTLAMLARNRYLLRLAQEEGTVNRSQLAVRHHALTELGRAAHDLVVRDFYSLGLVDVALRGDEVVGVRMSHLGRRLLGGEAPAPPDVRPLVVNPDFEVIVMPEGDLDDLLHELDRYAVRVRTGEVVHYRLDRTRIERAAVQDVPADEIVGLLARHCRAEVPQNVAYTIRSWAGGVRSATLERGLLFTASDPSVVESILRHPELKESVERVVDGTTVFFNHKVKRRRLAQELRTLGVYVR